MILAAVPKDYKIIKDEQEPISHTEWKGHWISMIPHMLLYLSSWSVFMEYHSFASNNRNLWSYSSVASRDGEGSLPDLHAIIFWLCTPMPFLLGTRRKRDHSSRVSALPRTSAWVSPNCWDLGADEQVGTALLTAHCDSTEIEEGPRKLYICSPCGDTMVSYPTSHCQTPVMTAGGEDLSIMTHAVFWLLNTFQRPVYEKVFFLGQWCWENLGTLA